MKIINKVAASVAVGLVMTLAGVSAQAAPTASPEPSAVSARALAHPCLAVVTYGNGPGSGPFSKDYRAYDRWCDGAGNYGGTWYGPWRLKKSTASHDRDVHNGQFG